MRILSPIRLEVDIYCLTMKSTNFFLFLFDDNSRLHCLISMFRESFFMLNSPEERLSLYILYWIVFINVDRLPSDKAYYQLSIASIWYMWTLKTWLCIRLPFHQPYKHFRWGILSQVQRLSLIYVEELTLVEFFSVPSVSAKDIDNGASE